MSQIVACAAYAEGKRIADIALQDGRQWASRPGHFVWIGLREPDAETFQALREQFGLHELALEDAIAQHTRCKLEIFGDALFMVLYSPIRADGELRFVETQLFAGKGYVISARYGDSAPYSLVRQRCEARPLLLQHGEDFVLYALLAFVLENYRPLLEQSYAELESLEQQVLAKPLTTAQIERIHQVRRDLLRLKRYVGPVSEICQELQQLDFPFIDKHMRPYFRDLSIHVTRLLEDLQSQREMADHAIELGLLLEASRQSLVQRKFAAWAAILAFPTAVAGIYGMNFDFMPELRWQYGYFAVLGTIGLGCIGLFANFKRLKWL